MPHLPIRTPRRHLLLALLLAGPSVLAAALPKVTFDARVLGERADTRTWPAEEYPLNFRAPRHLGVALGPKDDLVGGFEVYSLVEIAALNPDKNGPARQEIADLRALLARRLPGPSVKGELPFFPPKAGDQKVRAAVKYLDFPGGRGVRYLVAYTFDVAPLERDELFYTFVGLTNDGKHLVTFGNDVNLREIPQDYFATPALRQELDDVSNVNGAFRKHLARMTRVLDGLTNDSRLTRLDRFVQTIRVR